MKKSRHVLLKLALPNLPKLDMNIPTAGHADFAALMHSARQNGGQALRQQLGKLWPQADAKQLALAEGLGVALWLTEMLLFLREDAEQGRLLLPHDLMQQYLVDAEQIQQQRHDFALRRLGIHLAEQIEKILQASAPLGLHAPFMLKYRLRYAMQRAAFILHAMRHNPQAPFIWPQPNWREHLEIILSTLLSQRSVKSKSTSCTTGGCSH